MAFTYNSSNVGSSDLATVRFLIGDTSTGDPLLQDAEVNYMIGSYGNVKVSAAYACDAIVAKYARQADFSNEGLSVSASQRANAYRQMAKDLWRQVSSVAGISIGGLSQATKDQRAADTDLVQPAFVRGQDDFPNSLDSITSTG